MTRKYGNALDIGDTATTWLTQEFENGHTQRSHRSGLVAFMDANKITDLDSYVEHARETNQVMEHIAKTISWLREKNRAPLTIKTYLNGITQFFDEQDGITVDVEQLTKTKRRRGQRTKMRPRTKDNILDKVQLRRVIGLLPIHGKALFLTLLSSGLRIGEALALDVKDCFLNEDPPRIFLRDEVSKGGYGERNVFISYDAKNAIEEWWAAKPTRVKKNWSRDPFDPIKIFGYGYENARAMWCKALKQAGCGNKDSRTNRSIYGPHTLRKYFRSESMLRHEHINYLLGHLEGLDAHYFRTNEEKLRHDYLEHMHTVSLYNLREAARLDKIDKLEQENVALRKRLEQVEQLAQYAVTVINKEHEEEEQHLREQGLID